MTVSRFFSRRLLASIFLVLSATLAHAADAPNSGGTFNTPGYPAAPERPTGPYILPDDASAARQAQGASSLGSQPAAPVTPSIRNTPAPQTQSAPAPSKAPSTYPPESPMHSASPPSQFQKFVEAATGRMLPLFGSRFFAEAAKSYSPVSNVPVSADYVVGPGDQIILRAWGSIDVDYRATVDRNGQLHLPKVGSFNVAGIKAADLEANLRAQLGRLYTNFDLSVTLGELRGVKVFVVGPAERPGVYTLASQSTLLSAVVAAGGPAPNGSMRKVLLRRDGSVVSELDIYEFLVQGDKSKDVQLRAGDVIVFQPSGPQVALNGALDTPAIFELKSPQEPVREVLRYAGGTPLLANPGQVQLERVDTSQPNGARFVEEFQLDGSGLQKPLRDGDVLTLLAISPKFANAVTLKGHVAQPLRYPYTPGMRIRDLIPGPDALISPDFYRRKNLLVQTIEDPDERRADASTTAEPGAATTPDEARARQQHEEDLARVERSRKSPTALFDELNWDYAVIERLNKADLTTQVIPFNLGKAVLQGDEANNLALMPGDVVTVYSQKDIRVPVSRQTRLVSLEGEVMQPGVYQLRAGDTLHTLVARAGGFTPQAYLYGLEFSRESTRNQQRENLAAAIARLETLTSVQTARNAANRRDGDTGASAIAVSNASTEAQLSRLRKVQPNGRIALELTIDVDTLAELPDLPLEGGDRIIVPPRPGFVTVAGAVVNSNAFLWKEGRTAGDYLKLAGTDEAADPSNMFILRADGTVSHANDRHSFFGRSNLESQPMHPGDALVVPNQLDYETWGRAFVRNLKDWSQIFSQFGLGIAAIHSINN
jgi:protein involved in polysaccharide export with SLBB domain